MTTTTQKNKKLIEVRDLVVRYGERKVLDRVNMDVYENEIMVILGKSGCGKTTLLKTILGLHHSEEGSITLFGRDISILAEEEMNAILQDIGVLFQNGALLNSLTAGDNVAIPLTQHTGLSDRIIERIVKVKLNLVELHDALHMYPTELSGGMRKRVALARAIAMDPRLLFGDEPTAGLDPVTSASIDELILRLKHQLHMTVVVVTHELASIHRIADRVLFLENGKVLYCGDLEEAKKSKVPDIERFFSKGRY
jgi:phospholipid/cholesterol/gamma-HCH transport system ATP-binding protein